jgi:glycosyltransferase involved in cell wall biosynthesis
MKVLMFGWEFPPHITGGLGTACYGLAKGLTKHKVDLIFVVPKAYGDEDQRVARIVNASEIPFVLTDEKHKEHWNRIKYMEIGSKIVPYVDPEVYAETYEENKKTKESFTSKVFSKNYEFSGKYGPNLMEEISRYALIASTLGMEEDFDLIHAHDWLTYPAGIAAKKASGKPLVVHIHATEFDRSGKSVNKEVYNIEREGMQAADMVIAVSNLTRNTVIEHYGVDPKRVVTVHNAVDQSMMQDVQRIDKPFKEKLVTFLGRITQQKGPAYYVEAAHRILQKDKNVRFVMAGSGDMLNQMIEHASRLRISDKFHFTGFLKGKDINHVFAMSDVFVMPSVSEPFGIVPLEAMRSSVPVVISKQSGVAEILVHALKVDFWDVEGMADAIYGLLHYKSLTSVFRKFGKQEVENLKWEDAALKVKNVYESVLSNIK